MTSPAWDWVSPSRDAEETLWDWEEVVWAALPLSSSRKLLQFFFLSAGCTEPAKQSAGLQSRATHIIRVTKLDMHVHIYTHDCVHVHTFMHCSVGDSRRAALAVVKPAARTYADVRTHWQHYLIQTVLV